MATQVRNTSPDVAIYCAAHNDLKAQLGASTAFHLDKSEVTVHSADATGLTSSLALVREMMNVYNFHLADVLAHKVADTVDVLSETVASVVDLASAITAANDLKAQFNTHIASTTYHYNVDAANTVVAADATSTQTQLNTLANAIKSALNAHMASGPAAASLRVVGA